MGSSFSAVFRMAYDDSVPGAKRLSAGEIRRVARYFRPYLADSAWITLCILVTSVIGVVPPLLVRHVLDHDIPQKDVHSLLVTSGLMILLPAIGGLIGVLQNYLSVRV